MTAMLSHILLWPPSLVDEIDDDDGWCGPVSPDQPGEMFFIHPFTIYGSAVTHKSR